MNRFFYLLTIIIISFSLSACSTQLSEYPDTESQITETSELEYSNNLDNQQSQTDEIVEEHTYFEYDKNVNAFFNNYNSIAEITISPDEIEKGNIRTKALVYIDDLILEVVNSRTFLAVSITTAPENENSKLYSVFRDIIKSTEKNIEKDTIDSIWDDLHKTGYLVENYNFNGISITYVPYKKLSANNHSDLRIDLTIPIN